MGLERIRDELKPRAADHTTTVAKGILGALPFVGSMLAEVVGQVIPQQRMDRIVDVLGRLEARLSEVERTKLVMDLPGNPEAVDLLEEGMIQATRAVSDERREHVAALMKSTLTDSQLSHIERRKLWSVLESLNDVELLILQAKGLEHSEQEREFLERHKATLLRPPVMMGSSEQEMDQGALHETYRQHLRDLGLVRPQYHHIKRGELPEFDEGTGRMKASGDSLTRLGRLVLRSLGLPTRY